MNRMGLWKTTKTSNGKKRVEIDAKTLQLRLQSIMSTQNVEIIQLALQSMLEELEENDR